MSNVPQLDPGLRRGGTVRQVAYLPCSPAKAGAQSGSPPSRGNKLHVLRNDTHRTRSRRSPSSRLERQRIPIHAVPLAGRLGPIVEHVPQMPPAPPAMHLGPRHPQRRIHPRPHRVGQRLPKARPPGPALELGLRREVRQRAPAAREDPRTMLAIQRARIRTLGTFLAKDVVRIRRQLLPPLRVGQRDLEPLRRLRRLRRAPHKAKPAAPAPASVRKARRSWVISVSIVRNIGTREPTDKVTPRLSIC